MSDLSSLFKLSDTQVLVKDKKYLMKDRECLTTNTLDCLELSPWIKIEDDCWTRVLRGTDPSKVENRRAFIAKTPRILLNHVWVEGPKGDYGDEDGESRQWCDQLLLLLGSKLA